IEIMVDCDSIFCMNTDRETYARLVTIQALVDHIYSSIIPLNDDVCHRIERSMIEAILDRWYLETVKN
ncbi:hypothetical protein KDA23_06045, partial [Candidatus Saccharibacteria bacterium]|nr:hypothetical protein [Candidatus Saccharibacteria bacterium]